MKKDQRVVVQQMLHNAIKEKQPTDVLKYLIKIGANPIEIYDGGYNALHILVENKNEEMVIYILNMINERKFSIHQSDVDVRGGMGKTALHIAVDMKSVGIVKRLCDAGCALDICDDEGYTPFHRAVEGGDIALFSFLLKRGVRVDTKNNHGFTPFLSACKKGMFLFLEPLLKNGVNVNEVGSLGETGLYMASAMGHGRTVLTLLKCGADPYVKSKAGGTAFDAARVHYRHDISRILEEAKTDEKPKVEAEVPTFTLDDVKEWCSVNGYVLSKPI